MKILVLYSSGGSNRDFFINTNFNFLLKRLNHINGIISKIKNQKFQQFYHAITAPYESLSYVNDWKDSFEKLKNHKVISINVLNRKQTHRFLKKEIKNFDLIVLLHSVLGDNIKLIDPFTSYLLNRKGRLLSFVGNEYSLLSEKKEFLTQINVDYIASQLPKKPSSFLYNDIDAKLILAPHALNHTFYTPKKKKIFDVSFVGARYPKFIGDQERNSFIEHFLKQNLNLNNHISLGRNKNVPRQVWSEILQKSKATIGAEAGTYFLDNKGELLQKAKQYCIDFPNASVEELYEKIFIKHQGSFINGKAISSRHFEPIGTKTCQILLEGYYNGILKENEHYISVKKDYTNFEEAFEIYLDPNKRHMITENAYEYVLENHTYDIRVKTILNQIN